MRPDDILPPAFRALHGRVQFVRRHGNEFSSSCPKCGTGGHSGTEPPDRFRMFDDEHPTGWCRRCGFLWFPDSEGEYQKPSIEQFEAWRKKAEEREVARKRSAELALANLRGTEIWRRYHDTMEDHQRAYWRERGIPDGWQDFWCLGWREGYSLYVGDGRYHKTPAAVIPLFDSDWEVLNLKYRLIHPPEEQGKYRYDVQGRSQPVFRCDPSATLNGLVIAIEGELKAATCFALLDGKCDTMIGLPGATPAPHIIAMLKGAERVTLVLDPGAEKAAHDLATAIGRRKCRVLIPRQKIDDMAIEGRFTAYDMRRLLKQARPL